MPRRVLILAAAVVLIFGILVTPAASRTALPPRLGMHSNIRGEISTDVAFEPDFPSPRPQIRPHREAQAKASPLPPAPPVSYNGDHTALWLCIHSYEGSWTDPNPPYFGGLQMGYGFMEAYGGSLYKTLGTADHWTPDQQIAVAEGAWKINGYSVAWLYSQWAISGRDCA